MRRRPGKGPVFEPSITLATARHRRSPNHLSPTDDDRANAADPMSGINNRTPSSDEAVQPSV